MSRIRPDDLEAIDRAHALMMHVQTCAMCGNLQPIACEQGRTMAYAWLTFAAKRGSTQARIMLDRLKEGKWEKESLFPPGTKIRRI